MFHIILIIILLIFSAFFSSSETALFSLTNFQRKRIQSKNPHLASIISILLGSPRRTLATILIGNMLVNITAASAATVLAISYFGEKGIAISILFMTPILLIFGEVAPKTSAIRNPESLSVFCSPVLHIFAKLIWPLRKILRFMADIFISMFTLRREHKPYVTQNELKALMSISEKEGIIEDEEEEMIRSIFDLGEQSVDEIMTPRVDIAGCEKNASIQELIDVMRVSKRTKIPIYDETIDHIVGIVYTKDFMLHQRGDIQEFIKKPLYVPETERVDNLLIKFKTEKVYIAVVIDEFGGTSGIVTLEDVLEEIVGEIRDEYDSEIQPIKKEGRDIYIITGNASIREVNDELGLSLPMEEVTTINGLLLLLFGRVPQRGESIKFKGAEFNVVDVRKNMVIKSRIRILK
ncbi:MAG: hemolysin family protein [Candidatus Omnitrophota bacterium]